MISIRIADGSSAMKKKLDHTGREEIVLYVAWNAESKELNSVLGTKVLPPAFAIMKGQSVHLYKLRTNERDPHPPENSDDIRETIISVPDVFTTPPTSEEMTKKIYAALVEHRCKSVKVPYWFPLGIASELETMGIRVIPQSQSA